MGIGELVGVSRVRMGRREGKSSCLNVADTATSSDAPGLQLLPPAGDRVTPGSPCMPLGGPQRLPDESSGLG
jgi:hypothetical protein